MSLAGRPHTNSRVLGWESPYLSLVSDIVGSLGAVVWGTSHACRIDGSKPVSAYIVLLLSIFVPGDWYCREAPRCAIRAVGSDIIVTDCVVVDRLLELVEAK